MKSGGKSRERILEEALALFVEHGYEGTSTRAIAQRVGVTPAALYYHFPSKADCLAALLEPYLSALEAMLEAVPPGDPEALLRAYGKALLDHVDVARLIDDDRGPLRHPTMGPRLTAITLELRRRLSGPRPSRARLLRASAALGALRRPVLRLEARAADLPAVLEAALAALGK